MASEVRQLDTSAEIVTPENIAFRYRIAGPFRRLPAYLIDAVLRVLLVVGGMMIASFFSVFNMSGMAMGVMLVAMFVLDWFYGGLFEAFWNGQTPGKWIMRIRVVGVDGQPINAWQAVLRNVLRAVDSQPLFYYQLGFWSATFTPRYQRLGDLTSGTMVVIDERHRLQAVQPSGEPEAARVAAMIPANVAVSRSLGLALTSYVLRRRNFTPGRRAEIAAHLAEPLRQKFHLPADIPGDLLLCGLYERTFLADGDLPPVAANGTTDSDILMAEILGDSTAEPAASAPEAKPAGEPDAGALESDVMAAIAEGRR
jgi:uncharacterized RDD family membrane protein YckC